MAKIVKRKKGFDIVHSITGQKLGHRNSKSDARKLASEIRKRNKR